MAIGAALLCIIFLGINGGAYSASYTPVAILHGITATSESLAFMKQFIEKLLPGVYVHNVEVGNGGVDSIFWNMDHQVQTVCAALKNDSRLAGGVNVLGVSQGGLGMRGYLERCNDPPVRNFISWVSPQGGQFGCPSVGDIRYLNVSLDDLFDCCAYDDWVQDLLSFSGYWIDPYRYKAFVDRSRFLADLDNLRPTKNEQYKKNILNLENFVMSYSLIDTTLIPRETGYFSFYAENSVSQLVPLEDTDMYKQDWIGLRTLQESGRLHRFTTTCEHGDYASSCFQKYFLENVIPFLNVTST